MTNVLFLLLIKRYNGRYFPNALKPKIRGMLSDVQAGLEQQNGEVSSEASGSETPDKVLRTGSMQAMYAEMKMGNMVAVTTANINSKQLNIIADEPLPIGASYPMGQTATCFLAGQ